MCVVRMWPPQPGHFTQSAGSSTVAWFTLADETDGRARPSWPACAPRLRLANGLFSLKGIFDEGVFAPNGPCACALLSFVLSAIISRSSRSILRCLSKQTSHPLITHAQDHI